MVELKGNIREVVYTKEHWELLRSKRKRGLELLKVLDSCGIKHAILHGSVARGDVETRSDVDIALLYPYAPSIVLSCLERYGYEVYNTVIVQPTPIHTPKIYLYLDSLEELILSIPLTELEAVEVEFYRFSGMLTLNELELDKRVPGVNKRLMLIEPTSVGHREIPVIGNEGYVAKRLGVSMSVILDRVKALTRRSFEGHTGLFIEFEIPPNISIEEAIDRLCMENRLFRQRVSRYGLCI